MRITSKEQKMRSAATAAGPQHHHHQQPTSAAAADQQQHQQTASGQDQPGAAAVGGAAPQQPQSQPLQARSSNSGTSVKRSDNISQSSYPNGDISSDKPGQGGLAKTASASASQQPQLTIGQTTTAFAQRREAATTPTSTANGKNAEMGGPSGTTLNNKRATNTRRSAAASNTALNQDTHQSLSTSASQQAASQEKATNQSGTQPTSRVSTRASGRQTRQSDQQQRAVKDLLHSSTSQHHQQLSQGDTIAAALGAHQQALVTGSSKQMSMLQSSQQQMHSAATAVSAITGLPTATSHRNSLDELAFCTSESSMLKPVKQSNSEQPQSASASSGTMRTTRSKAKAKQTDKKGGPGAAKRLNETPAADANISNGQSEQQKTNQDQHMNDGRRNSDVEVDDSEPILIISANDGKVEKTGNLSSVNLKPSKRLDQDMLQPWQHVGAAAEESKLQSPRSLNSTLIAAAQGDKTANNQSFRINDSTDSLLENPLTTVIKQFQNLRTNAQLTGKNKPTIQQFLEKFEKEMQQLEDQYQAQQQAREEQMRLFEQHYGGKKSVDFQGKLGASLSRTPVAGAASASYMGAPQHLPYAAHQLGNDQQVAAATARCATGGPAPIIHQTTSNQAFCDALMVQDTATLGPMPHDQCNTSFNSAVHGPNNAQGAQSVFGGASSDITHSEVYESFTFNQNSMMQFYPRQVRKILARRKTTNSASTILSELRDLKAPKHKLKMKKTMSKMQSLAICQMNMMQILLQKVSRRSKVIRKQEKLVNDNLKRKRIYLERDHFDLMSVLRKSLEVTEQREQHSQQVQAAAISAATTQLNVAQKNKTHNQRATTGGSDLNSNCLSTSGTRYGTVDQPNTHSIKSTTAAAHFGEENTSMDGCQSRKQTRLQSGAEHCLSVAADSISYKALHNNIMEGSVKAQQATPEPPSKKVITNHAQQSTAMNAAANHNNMASGANNMHLSGEHQQLPPSSAAQGGMPLDLASAHQAASLHHHMHQNPQQKRRNMEQPVQNITIGHAGQDQIFAPNSPIISPGLLQTPQKNNKSSQQALLLDDDEIIEPQLHQQHFFPPESAEVGHSEQQRQHHIVGHKQQPRVPLATASNGIRKGQTTNQGKQRKRKSNLLLGSSGMGGQQQAMQDIMAANGSHTPMILEQAARHHQQALPPQLALDMESAMGDAGSGCFAIADLGRPTNPAHIKTEHLADGNFSITIKKNKLQQQTGVAPQAASRSRKMTTKQANMKSAPAMDQEMDGGDVGLYQHQRHTGGVEHQLQDRQHQNDQEIDDQLKQDSSQRKQLSPLRNNITQEHQQQQQQQQHHHHQQQQNTTNVPMQFAESAADIDDNDDFFAGLQHPLNMVSHPDHHLVDHHMQPDHFMMGGAEGGPAAEHHHHHQVAAHHQLHRANTVGIYPEFIKHHPHHQPHHGGQAIVEQPQVQAQMSNTPGGHYQPLLPSGQMTELAMHRSQSVMLPHSGHHNHYHHHHHNLLDSHHFEQYAHVQFVGAEDVDHHDVNDNVIVDPRRAGLAPAGEIAHRRRGDKQPAHHHDHHDVLDLNFFDESAQELSSIDHSAAAVDAYGYNQAGPNPYEQAKRQYLKKQQSQQPGSSDGVGVSHQSGERALDHQLKVDDTPHHQQQQFESRVNNFVSPMVVGLQQLSSDQQTPQAKADAPSHFMSGVVDHQTGLGRGTGQAGAQPQQDSRRATQHQQLSVNRMCGGIGGANDPFNMSAQRAGQINTFGNTPAGLMSNGQPCMATDAHRQHLSVSGWNLVDDETPHHHHNHQQQEGVHVVGEEDEIDNEIGERQRGAGQHQHQMQYHHHQGHHLPSEHHPYI